MRENPADGLELLNILYFHHLYLKCEDKLNIKWFTL